MPDSKVVDIKPGVTVEDRGKGPKYDSDYNDLSSGSDVGVEEKEEEIEEKGEKETEEVEEEIEKTEEETEEDDKRNELFHRPTVKEIKTEFPEFFSKFPSVRDALFREIEYTKLFPTVDDAKEAFTENEAFSVMSEAALSGNPEPIIESLEKTDKKALQTFSLSFLPELYKRDQETYYTIITPLFENMLKQAYNSKDENLKNSALNIGQYLFGDDGEAVLNGKKTYNKNLNLSEEQKRLNEVREVENSKKFRDTANYISNEVHRIMIGLASKDIDVERNLSKFVRDQIAEEVVRRVDQQLTKDSAHVQIMSARWKRCKQNGYSDDERSKLIAAYLARAKSLIGPVRDKVKKEALGESLGKESREERIKKSVVEKEVPLSSSGRREISDKNKKEYRKMTDLEILSS
jgi:hypothetical protein